MSRKPADHMRLYVPKKWRKALACIAPLFFAGIAPPAQAADVIQLWAKVQPPHSPPALKPVVVDDAHTALLILDFAHAQDPAKGPCGADTPRCLASVPAVQALLARARDKGVFVVYSVGPSATPAAIAPAIAPKPSDPVVKAFADKFVGTNLGQLLQGKAITTLIVTGTAAEGAVLDTATDGIFRGYKVVIPVDGMSSPELYAEQYVAWHFTHAPSVTAKTTLTRSDMIKF